MCYIIESKQHFDFDAMILTIEKTDVAIKSMKIWITSDYDFLLILNRNLKRKIVPFESSVPIVGTKTARITLRETIIKPLHCKKSGTEYTSELQCLVNMFINEDFSPCPIKCVPVQMKAFQYVNKSTSLISCSKIEDEICNGGPKVWNSLRDEFQNCLNPCKMRTYKDSRLEFIEPMYEKVGETLVNFELVKNNIRNIEKHVLVYDTIDVIGVLGGTLGLLFGFSFFDIISKCLDNLIMPLMIYLSSQMYCNEKQPTLVRSKPVQVQKPSNLVVTSGQ